MKTLPAVALMLLGGCATLGSRQPENPDVVGLIPIEGKSGHTLAGLGTFTKDGEAVRLSLSVTGAPPGLHAVHLHERGDCSASDATSAGEHWNPTGHQHGQLGDPPTHLGDIGNLTVNRDGTGTLEFRTDQWSVNTGAENDILDKALIIHASTDDFVTQPSGNAGERIGCGVVVRPPAPPVASR